MAEVFAIGPDRVVKLDLPEFNGVAIHEANVLRGLRAAGLPVPDVFETIVHDGRHGVVMERLDGPSLADVIRTGDDIEPLAVAFVELHERLHLASVAGLPDLRERLASEIDRSGLPSRTTGELLARLGDTGDEAVVCHFDLHPENIIVTSSGWVVIDWLTAATGPSAADFARSLLLMSNGLMSNAASPAAAQFAESVRRHGQRRRELDDAELGWWTRIVAAARLAEGFTGEYAARLHRVAMGD
jgi:tRNA A-37 threonylcarbamoyl transferase component Bud32